MSRGSTCATRSLGSGLEDWKLLFTVGIVELDWKNLLYADRLELHSSGDLCGELYSAIHKMPRENMSEDTLRLLSSTKSGDVKSRLSWRDWGSLGSGLRIS